MVILFIKQIVAIIAYLYKLTIIVETAFEDNCPF